MVGHTFSKLYATTLHLQLFEELKRRNLQGRGQAGFRPRYQIMDHILTLWAIIEEVRHHSSKVFCCFVDFQKAFDSVLQEAMFQRLRDIGVSKILIVAIM
jgi:hypothetical protein